MVVMGLRFARKIIAEFGDTYSCMQWWKFRDDSTKRKKDPS